MSWCVKFLFTVSVLLNVALVGVVAGHFMKKQERWNEVHAELAPETRELMKEVYRNKRSVIRANMKTAAEKEQQIAYIFSEEDFDAQKFQDAVRDWLIFHEGVTKSKLKTMVQVAEQTSQEERVKLSKRFVSVLVGKHMHRKGRKNSEGGKCRENE